MNEFLISVIIPTYNRSNFILRSIESVLNQTYTNWELIIIDDGSTDNTKEVVQGITDDRIKYYWQVNQEKCIARNNGISKARGEYICFLDNDDYYLPHHLEGLYNKIIELNHPVAMLVSGLYIEEDGIRKEHPQYDGVESALRYVWRHFIVPTATCHHRNVLNDFKFSDKYYIWEDRHLWLRILTKYPLIQIPVYSVILFEHSGRSTKKFYSKISLKSVTDYFSCIEDVFGNFPVLYDIISLEEKNQFKAKRALTYLEIAVLHAQWKEYFFLLKVLLKTKPSFIRQWLFYKLPLLLIRNTIFKRQEKNINS